MHAGGIWRFSGDWRKKKNNNKYPTNKSLSLSGSFHRPNPPGWQNDPSPVVSLFSFEGNLMIFRCCSARMTPSQCLINHIPVRPLSRLSFLLFCVFSCRLGSWKFRNGLFFFSVSCLISTAFFSRDPNDTLHCMLTHHSGYQAYIPTTITSSTCLPPLHFFWDNFRNLPWSFKNYINLLYQKFEPLTYIRYSESTTLP